MSNLRLRLLLDLVAKTAGPARAARRDLSGVKTEAARLKATRGPEALTRDLQATGRAASTARREIASLASKSRQLRGAGGAGGRRDVADARRRIAEERATAQAGGAGTVIAAGRNALAAVGGYYAVRKAIRSTVGEAVTFEKAMADVKKKVDLPVGESWEGLERTIVKSAIAFGRSREEVAALVAEAGAAGIGFYDLAEFTKLATKAAVGWDMKADEAAQKLSEIRAATGWTIPQLTDYADKVNALGDTSAAKERDIVEMFSRAGAAAQAANVSFDASLASLTALKSIGMQEEVSARFFVAFTGRLRTATHAGKKAAEGFKMLGTSAERVEKGMKTKPVDTMIDVLERLERSPDKAAAAIKIFGREWWDEAARMGQAIPELVKNLRTLSEPANWKGSLEKNLNIELATAANHLDRLKTLASEVGDRLGKWALPGINKSIEDIIAAMDRLDNSAGWIERWREKERARLAESHPGQSPELVNAENNEKMRDSQVQIAQILTGDETETRTLGEIGRDFLFGKADQKDKQLQDARLAGFREARAAVAAEEDRAFKAEADARDVLEFARGRRERVAAAGRPTRVHDKQIAEKEAAYDHAAEVARRARQTRADRMRRDEQAAQDADHAVANYRPLPFGLQGPAQPAAPDGPGAVKPLDPRQWFKLDLDPGGATIMQRLADQIEAGRGDVEGKAAAIGTGIRSAIGGVDLQAQGQAMMGSLAAGIAAGGDQAVAAARSVAARVRDAAGSATTGGSNISPRARLSGALHDGPTQR